MARAKSAPKDSTADLVFEAKLWLAADKPRYNADTVKYITMTPGTFALPKDEVASTSCFSGSVCAVTTKQPRRQKA